MRYGTGICDIICNYNSVIYRMLNKRNVIREKDKNDSRIFSIPRASYTRSSTNCVESKGVSEKIALLHERRRTPRGGIRSLRIETGLSLGTFFSDPPDFSTWNKAAARYLGVSDEYLTHSNAHRLPDPSVFSSVFLPPALRTTWSKNCPSRARPLFQVFLRLLREFAYFQLEGAAVPSLSPFYARAPLPFLCTTWRYVLRSNF